MVDRQDIDALLISALYGELTPADEARLTAHLESHPADRSALDGLTQTRAAVRDSRFLSAQVDPPQAISALLLQEAARRAPRKVVARDNESWFTRFAGSFLRHPAMAAATMLVLVGGVSGLLYMRNGDQFAASKIDRRESEQAAQPPTMTATLDNSVAAGSGAQQQFRDGTAKAGDDSARAADPTLAVRPDQDAYRVDLADDFGKQQALDVKPSAKKGSTAGDDLRKRGGIEVRTADPKPKEFASDEKLKYSAPSRSATKNTIAGKADEAKAEFAPNEAPMPTPSATTPGFAAPANGAGAAGPSTGNAPQAQAPRAPVVTAPPAPPADKVVAKPSPKPAVEGQTTTDLAWAKDTHARVTTLVRNGNCADAAKEAAKISTRTPDYYNQHVANDRALKQCLPYINDAREKDAERSNKARAQKRIDANEPAPTSVK